MINSYLPKNPVVARLIDYYYFQQTAYSTEHYYTYYPNNRITISFYRGSQWRQAGKVMRITSGQSSKISAILTPTATQAASVCQVGPIDKLGLVFPKHMINRILPLPLGKLCSQATNFWPIAPNGFYALIQSVFESSCPEERVLLLDDYLFPLLQLSPHPSFDRAIHLLEGNLQNPIEAIALELNCNRKSLYRWFQHYLNCSPEQYRQIVKFRSSIQWKLDEPKAAFGTIAQEHYTDQAHFSRSFKRLAHCSPRQFFKQVSQVGKHATYWSLQS